METVPGTIGYAQAADRFIELSESITFEKLHRPILEFVPTTESDVLDIGSGSGRDAAALARMGHNVTAVEPNSGFIETATRIHPLPNIQWIEDSLPSLSALTTTFDFILCHGVWQHIDHTGRIEALVRISEILNHGGIFAVALRHGPVGNGTHYFQASADETVTEAARVGLDLVLNVPNQASALPNKGNVTWTRLAFRRNHADV